MEPQAAHPKGGLKPIRCTLTPTVTQASRDYNLGISVGLVLLTGELGYRRGLKKGGRLPVADPLTGELSRGSWEKVTYIP